MEFLQEKPDIYIRLTLRNKWLSELCRKRLERFGVECLEEAGPHEAYGIITDVEETIWWLLDDPGVLHVERKEPPSGK